MTSPPTTEAAPATSQGVVEAPEAGNTPPDPLGGSGVTGGSIVVIGPAVVNEEGGVVGTVIGMTN